MNIFKQISFLIVLATWVSVLQGQVKFQLTLLEDGQTYQVDMISEATIAPPFNVISTAQITLKTTTGSFEVNQFFNVQPEVIWEPNSKTVSPEEAPDFDYISFGLISQGTNKLLFEAGEKIPLFQFTNFLDCSGGVVSLVNNQEDPFFPPNSEQVNIGNHITILGAMGDAYMDNTTNDEVPCGGNLTNLETISLNDINAILSPNPAQNHIFLSFDWNRQTENSQLQVIDLSGKVVKKEQIKILTGKNFQSIDISALATGTYFIALFGQEWKLDTDKFVKATP